MTRTTTTRIETGKALEARISQSQRHERNGDPRAALLALQPVLDEAGNGHLDRDLTLRALFVASDCAFRVSDYATGLRHIERIEALGGFVENRAARASALALALVHRARIYYQQGRYSQGRDCAQQAATMALEYDNFLVAARARMCQNYIAAGQEDLEAAERYIEEGIAFAERSGDEYIHSWLLNNAGLHYFHQALKKVLPQHSRGHPSSADPADFSAVAEELSKSAHLFKLAIAMATKCRSAYQAQTFELNLSRVRVAQGEGRQALTPLRRALRRNQDQGLKDSELVIRYTYAWALRTCGHWVEALRQLDAALLLARSLGRVNRSVELLHYDRSLVLSSIGDHGAAMVSYRRYLRLHASGESAAAPSPAESQPPVRPPLEPFYMKRADHFLVAHVSDVFELESLAQHCGVSSRSLQLGFKKFRGVTPMSYSRNLRLDAVHRELQSGSSAVATVASQFGFKSLTTFSTEYRRRFGVPPRLTVVEARKRIVNNATAPA